MRKNCWRCFKLLTVLQACYGEGEGRTEGWRDGLRASWERVTLSCFWRWRLTDGACGQLERSIGSRTCRQGEARTRALDTHIMTSYWLRRLARLADPTATAGLGAVVEAGDLMTFLRIQRLIINPYQCTGTTPSAEEYFYNSKEV